MKTLTEVSARAYNNARAEERADKAASAKTNYSESRALEAAANALLEKSGFKTHLAPLGQTFAVPGFSRVKKVDPYHKEVYENVENCAQGKKDEPRETTTDLELDELSLLLLLEDGDFAPEEEQGSNSTYLEAVELLENLDTAEGRALVAAVAAQRKKRVRTTLNSKRTRAEDNKLAKVKKLLAAGKKLPKHLEALVEEVAVESTDFEGNRLENELNGLDFSTFPVEVEFEHTYNFATEHTPVAYSKARGFHVA